MLKDPLSSGNGVGGSGCVAGSVNFEDCIKPILFTNNNCFSCHPGTDDLNLTDYDAVKGKGSAGSVNLSDGHNFSEPGKVVWNSEEKAFMDEWIANGFRRDQLDPGSPASTTPEATPTTPTPSPAGTTTFNGDVQPQLTAKGCLQANCHDGTEKNLGIYEVAKSEINDIRLMNGHEGLDWTDDERGVIAKWISDGSKEI